MRNIRIEKITLNVGAGKDEGVLQRGVKLFKLITGVEPVKTITRKRVPSWGLRPGLAIGCKYTLRGEKATELLKRLLESKDNRLSMKQFDKEGNFSFGISEYIDIPGVEYDPEIKIMGFEVAVTLERPGFHIKKRKINARSIPQKHRITKEDAIQYMKDNFSLIIAEEEE
jgi:large subunit ribosomal protein L5